MMCESGGDAQAKNPQSTASGLFQFLDGTANWVGKEVYGKDWNMGMKNNPDVQWKMAIWLYDNFGDSHWEYPCGSLNAPV
jgi:hypothetical protein